MHFHANKCYCHGGMNEAVFVVLCCVVLSSTSCSDMLSFTIPCSGGGLNYTELSQLVYLLRGTPDYMSVCTDWVGHCSLTGGFFVF